MLDLAGDASDSEKLKDSAQKIFDDAERELDDAQQAYDDTLTAEGVDEILNARAEVTLARERYNRAQDDLRMLQTGAESPRVKSAAKSVDQAQASFAQAEAAVKQAQAQLDLIDKQIEKLTVFAPQDGVVLTRSLQPGEVAQAGMTAMTTANLDELTITVYLPENRYGDVSLGEQAALRVDSFPNETFSAVVTRIADKAEYTPRNVQTQEERQTTVYAIELKVENPTNQLKPGMPVDVEFSG
jgi:multidrug resistance efflux pump